MARKFVNLCVVFALMTGCWGGVLAAAACPHVGCETPTAAPHADATHGGHPGGHDVGSFEEHSGHAGGHEGHAAEPPSGEVGPVTTGYILSGGHDPNCEHCLGRPEAPPSPNFEVQSNTIRKGVESAAPNAAHRVEAPAAAFPREITPAQHAPPGRTVRHLLISVFRI